MHGPSFLVHLVLKVSIVTLPNSNTFFFLKLWFRSGGLPVCFSKVGASGGLHDSMCLLSGKLMLHSVLIPASSITQLFVPAVQGLID